MVKLTMLYYGTLMVPCVVFVGYTVRFSIKTLANIPEVYFKYVLNSSWRMLE